MFLNCKYCNKIYKNQQNLNNHINIKHTNIIIHNYICNYCNKKLSNRQSRWRHEKICKYKNTKNEIIQNNTNELKTNITLYGCNITNMNNNNINIKTNDNIKTTDNNNININTTDNNNNNNININIPDNNNNNININTTDNNNNININTNNNNNIIFNYEFDIDKLCITEQEEITNYRVYGVLKLIEIYNFNKKYPENHIFCSTSKDCKYLKNINPVTQQVEITEKKYYFNEILYKSIVAVKKIFNKFIILKPNNKDIYELCLKSIDEFCKDRNEYVMSYYNDLNRISYNNKKLVCNTWKNCGYYYKTNKIINNNTNVITNDNKNIITNNNNTKDNNTENIDSNKYKIVSLISYNNKLYEIDNNKKGKLVGILY